VSQQPLPGKRINVVGTSGSGKTTMAARLADILGGVHVELDALSHGPNWTMRSDEEFDTSVREFAQGECWVACGNYTRVRSTLWPQADTIVWLDYSFPLVFGRVFRRTMIRSIRGTELWHGNKERLWIHFFTRDSLLLWVLKTYRHNRRKYTELRASPEYQHLTWIRLTSPAEAEEWLARVRESGGALQH
jgi:adenylate kinase family enzyme